ncbi:MAG: hypothetical protein R2734_14120 [Nocardioides sp.]
MDHRPSTTRYVRRQHRARPSRPTGMVRVDAETNLGVAVSTDCNSRLHASSTRTPARGALLESTTTQRRHDRGQPLAVSDCLGFGSPEDPDVMWQFAEACRGLKDACAGSASPSLAAASASTADGRHPPSCRPPWSPCSA